MVSATDTPRVVRFAPSPTGVVHLGTARTALFNYLFAKKYGAKYILRIEDTDRERSKQEFEDNILESMAWLGITSDETYRQSDRGDIYKKYLNDLIEKGLAYVSKEDLTEEQRAEDPERRNEVIRFKNPNKIVTFHDEIRGTISFDTTELGDFVIAKSLEEPLYHLAVVIDDFEMGVTHIIRGEDHISNTPRQILVQEAIGAPRPLYFHLPLILGHDRAKLSKRHGALPVLEYRNAGFLSDAVVNCVAFLGWNPGTNDEVFPPKELIEAFSIEGLQKSPAVYSDEKLSWLNKKHIALLPDETVREYALAYLPLAAKEQFIALGARIIPHIRERINKFGDLRDTYADEWQYFFERPAAYPKEKLVQPVKKPTDTPVTEAQTAAHLAFIIEKLTALDDAIFSADTVKNAVWDYATEQGRGAVLWPMRYALSGRDRSLDPINLAYVLGKQETLSRLEAACTLLS